MAKKRIGVIFGGRSGEHEVALVSASSIIGALDKDKYDIVPIGITKKGEWIAEDDSLGLLKAGQFPHAARAILPADPNSRDIMLLDESGKELSESKPLDVVFPVMHGPYGEDGKIQGLLEMTDIPYVGCGVLGSAVCMDKVVQKQLCEHAGLKSVKFIALHSHEAGDAKELTKEFTFPVFVKPANMGSSVGIAKVKEVGELEDAVEDAFQYDTKIIIEESVEGAQEFEVALLGNMTPKASVVGEIRASNEFYDYNAKYVDGKSEEIIPAEISEELELRIQEQAIKAFQVTECRGMARVDFLYQPDSDTLYLNEINTIPGFTQISMYPKLWEASGMPYAQLLDELIELAIEEHEMKSKLKTSFTPKNDWYKQ